MRGKVHVWLGVVATLFVVGLGAAFLFAGAGAPPAGVMPAPAGARVQADARVTLRYMLPDGSEASLLTTAIPADLVGATLSEARALRPDWEIVDLQRDRLAADVRCPTGGYLGVQDGLVAIFAGRPGPCSVLQVVTEMTLASVHPAAQEKLLEGMIFADDDERQALLDGLVSD